MPPERADGEQVSTLGSSTLKETSVGVEFSMDLSRLLPVRSCAFLGCGLHSSHLGSSSCSGASPFYASSRAASDLLQYSGNPSFRYNIRHGSLSSQVVINRRQSAGAQLEERVCKARSSSRHYLNELLSVSCCSALYFPCDRQVSNRNLMKTKLTVEIPR